MDNWKQDLRRWVKSQSRFKLGIAVLVITVLPFFIFSTPRGSDFRKNAALEIEIAKSICVASYAVIANDPRRLKMNKTILNDIPVNGEIPKLKYVDYPRVMSIHSGFARINSNESFYCEINDPRGRNEFGTNAYYFDYKDRTWRGAPILHLKNEGFTR